MLIEGKCENDDDMTTRFMITDNSSGDEDESRDYACGSHELDDAYHCQHVENL